MERIAVISDIHGNMPALQAVELDLRKRGISRIFCLGDLVGKGPEPELVVDWVRDRCELVVQGNWDDFIGKPTKKAELLWHQHRLGRERLEYLSALPFSYDFLLSGKTVRIFHASPESVYSRIQPWDEPERRLSMFEDSAATGPSAYNKAPDAVGYGDVHNAFVQHFPGKLLFNTGSVGNPLEIPQASYAILEGVYGSREPGALAVTLVRVPYDVERAIRIAAESRMPLLEPYAKELRTGRFRGRT